MTLQLAVDHEPAVKKNIAIEIVPTTKSHIKELIRTIRKGDKEEIEIYGFTCAKGLWRSFRTGMMNKTAILDGQVAAIWGVGGMCLGEEGQPWLLTSEAIKKVSPLKFARAYQHEVYKMLEIFPKLSNYVAADYPEAVRLLSIVGFTIGEPEPLGKGGMYRKFTMEKR